MKEKNEMRDMNTTALAASVWAVEPPFGRKASFLDGETAVGELDSLLEFIWEAPREHLPSCSFERSAALLRRNLPEFANVFLKEHLRSCCLRSALSGRLRRLPRGVPCSGCEELDFVVTPHGFDGRQSSLGASSLLGFLRCYQLLWYRGGIRVSLKFSAALGFYYYSLLTFHGRLRVWVCPPERFGIALLLTTGPSRHLKLLSLRARQRGCSPLLPEGLYTAKHRLVSEEEEDIYAALGLEWIAPDSRNGEELPPSSNSEEEAEEIQEEQGV
ncbi:MAG: hypothetical protein ACOX2U_04095 [Limisphaerales bacterium]|nr:hypothetical protein [Verrucomicrobiota bacterium]